MREYIYYVYILTRKRNSTFYIGMTNDLARRVSEHKEGKIPGFTKKYNIKTLVYYECFDDVFEAIYREKVIKKWKRSIKIQEIERMNPEWRDLYFDLTQESSLTSF